MINILIADDIPVLRQGLKAIFEDEEDINVVGVAGNGKEAFELCVKKHPDVVLMDMRMPDFDGEYGTRQIKQSFPEIKVLVLTTFDDSETVSKALSSGADGYILKEMENDRIINSIKTVNGGINVFGANIFSSIKKNMQNNSSCIESYELTDREIGILKMISEGKDNKEIASELFLAEGTVRNNISRLLEKLHLKDRTQLAVFAVRNNIV